MAMAILGMATGIWLPPWLPETLMAMPMVMAMVLLVPMVIKMLLRALMIQRIPAHQLLQPVRSRSGSSSQRAGSG